MQTSAEPKSRSENPSDAIVLGTGGMGSATLYHLARRGAKVLGIDRFDPPHDRGSSHGQTRIIRQAYFEHPDYVPLLSRAYDCWTELEQAVGRQLFHKVGLVEVGHPQGEVIQGILKAAAKYRLPVDQLSPQEVARQWPQLAVPQDCAAVFERNAGYLLVEECIAAHLAGAEKSGAALHTGERVRHWSADGQSVVLQTDRGSYRCQKLIVTAGPWAAELLSGVGVKFEVRRKSMFWYATDDERFLPSAGCPAFFYELPWGVFYGFPQLDARGVKLAEHSGGSVVTDPLHIDRAIFPDDQQRIEQFIGECVPALTRQVTEHSACMYTMSPDEHFVVGSHPRHDNVLVAAGLSGHGFKFTGMLGEVLAELALEGATRQPVGFLSPLRFM